MPMRLNIAAPLCVGLCMLLTFMTPADAQVSRETWSDIQLKLRQRQTDEVVARVEAMLAAEEPTTSDRVRLFQMGEQALSGARPPRYEQAITWLQRVVDDQTLPAGARIDAIERMADVQILLLGGQDLHTMDLGPAFATLHRPLSWKELSPRDLAKANVHIGHLHQRAESFDKARQYYLKAIDLETDQRTLTNIHKHIAYSWAGQGDFAAARQICTEHNIDLIDLYQKFNMTREQHDACVDVLDDAAATESQRWNAFRRLPAWHVYTRDLAVIRAMSEKYLPAFTASNEDRPRQVFSAVLRRMSADKDPAFILWAGPQVIASPKCTETEYAQVTSLIVEALAVTRDIQQVQSQAAALHSDERLPVTSRAWLSLVAQVLASQSTAKVSAILDAATLDEKSQLTAEEKSDALLMAARTLLRCGHETLARELHQAQRDLLKEIKPASLKCVFVPAAPADITQWLEWVKNDQSLATAHLDRPYGNNLQFLVETDSASTGRTVAQQTHETSNDSRTQLHVLCDDKGIHLFLLAYDSQADQVAAGTVRGGGYEMYLAPGHQQAYHTFLADIATGRFDPQMFLTHYPAAHVHPLSYDNQTFESQTRKVQGGFATSMFMSWAAFHDKLPQDNDRWQFEAIRWTRQGGFSFGGSKSVHNRSSWGDLVFQGIGKAQLQDIRRRIINTALQRYAKSKSITSPVGNWADPDLGDVHFHQNIVAPLLDRLDKAAAAIRSDMTEAEISRLYISAVPYWMDLEHHVAALRRTYLQDQLLAP